MQVNREEGIDMSSKILYFCTPQKITFFSAKKRKYLLKYLHILLDINLLTYGAIRE